jgi:hypothetical protein
MQEHGTTEPETRSIVSPAGTVRYHIAIRAPCRYSGLRSCNWPVSIPLGYRTKTASATGYPLKRIPISAVAGFPYSRVGVPHKFPVSTGKRALTEDISTMARRSSSIMILVWIYNGSDTHRTGLLRTQNTKAPGHCESRRTHTN